MKPRAHVFPDPQGVRASSACLCVAQQFLSVLLGNGHAIHCMPGAWLRFATRSVRVCSSYKKQRFFALWASPQCNVRGMCGKEATCALEGVSNESASGCSLPSLLFVSSASGTFPSLRDPYELCEINRSLHQSQSALHDWVKV